MSNRTLRSLICAYENYLIELYFDFTDLFVGFSAALSLLAQLALSKWRSRFGRPTKIDPALGEVVGGSYCKMPEDWLQKKIGREMNRFLVYFLDFYFFISNHLEHKAPIIPKKIRRDINYA